MSKLKRMSKLKKQMAYLKRIEEIKVELSAEDWKELQQEIE